MPSISRWSYTETATGLRSSAIEEVIPFGHEAFIIGFNVTKDAEQVIYQTLAEASLGIEGLPLIVGVKRDGEPSTVPNKDFTLMPKDRSLPTSGLGSFSRILTAFGHESIDFLNHVLPLSEQPMLVAESGELASKWRIRHCDRTKSQIANNLSGSDIGAHATLTSFTGISLIETFSRNRNQGTSYCYRNSEDDHVSIAAALCKRHGRNSHRIDSQRFGLGDRYTTNGYYLCSRH